MLSSRLLAKLRSLAILAGVTGMLSGCLSNQFLSREEMSAQVTQSPSEQPAAAQFRVIGYVTDAIVVETIRFDLLTHINYAFLIPKDDGTFQKMNNPWKLDQVVSYAHESGVKALISVGGWGWDAEFESLAASPETRAIFVAELVKFVEQHALDGVDIDWEYPDPGDSAQNFLTLIEELRAALPDKLLTAAVVASGPTGEGIPSEALGLMDFVNIMAYDGGGLSHSSFDYAQDALDYWHGRGLPPEKTVLGVPFYARPDGTPYHKILKVNPQAANTDFTDYYGVTLNYNGIPTIRQKTALAMQRASGVMIWALEHDSSDSNSLLKAIDQAIQEK